MLHHDHRIKYTIADEALRGQLHVTIASSRGYMAVLGSSARPRWYSCDDGSFVCEASAAAERLGFSLAFECAHDRLWIVYHKFGGNQLHVCSVLEGEFEFAVEHEGFRPCSVAVDHKHHRVLAIASNRVVALSALDGSLLFEFALPPNRSEDWPDFLCVDQERDRIIVTDSNNNRVQVLSSIDGSFLFEFGSRGNQSGQLLLPHGVCIDNQGRIIVADHSNRRLQAFTHEGHHISSFDCGTESPAEVAFDEHRGLIAFSAGDRVHVIGANQWLPGTFTWRPDLHRYAPSWMKQAVSTMTMIRSLVDESAMSMIPNELLFEIFSHL